MIISSDKCSLCRTIKDIKQNPYFVYELSTGYVLLGKYQFFKGYTLFLCKQHISELHDLSPKFRRQFLLEMSQVAEAVFKAFKPIKLNYELLGNTDPHLHWHLFPRYKNDPQAKRPIWCISRKITMSQKAVPSPKQLNLLKIKIIKSLDLLINNQ